MKQPRSLLHGLRLSRARFAWSRPMLLNANTVPCNQGPFQLESASWYQDWIPEAALSVSLMPSSKALQKLYSQHHSECIHFTICLQRKMKKSTLSTALSTAFSAFSHALLALGTSFRSPAAWLKGWSNCWNTFQNANRIQMVFLEDLDRPCQLPWPRFSKHLARRRGLLRPGS